MIWMQVIRMKWRTSIGSLMRGRECSDPSLQGYPSQLFDRRPNSSPVSENEEDEFVSALHPSSHRLHIAFHFLLYRFSVHKDLALPPPPPCEIAVSRGKIALTQCMSTKHGKPTLDAQVRHLKISKLLMVLDQLIVVQERLFRRLEEKANCSEWVQDKIQHLFRVLEKESEKIQDTCIELPVGKEERYETEKYINALIDALHEIMASYHALAQSWIDVVGNVATGIADTGENPWPNMDTIDDIRRGIPSRYTVTDYQTIVKSFETESEWI